jgi:hypothetical protein
LRSGAPRSPQATHLGRTGDRRHRRLIGVGQHGREAGGSAWDSVVGFSSHDAITEAAIDAALSDPANSAGFKQWLALASPILKLYAGGTIPQRYGELIHGVKRPLGPLPAADECPGYDDYFGGGTTGLASYAVGNNPGSNHPEYWWQTSVCLWRHGNYVQSMAVLGQLIHMIEDQGSPPHAMYKMHGALSGGQNFEFLSALADFDFFKSVYYSAPGSLFYPGKNVLDTDDHGDGDERYFHIPKHLGDYRLIPLGSGGTDDPKPTVLQTPSPRVVEIDTSVDDPAAFPVIEMQVWYEKVDGTIGIRDHRASLNYFVDDRWVIQDDFAPNGRLWLFFKRGEDGWRSSTGDVEIYVNQTIPAWQDVPKPSLHHPWEYYDFIKAWTQWSLQSPFMRKYFIGLNHEGPLAFDILWATAPNSERALLSQSWAISTLVTKWVLEDAYRLLSDPTYGPVTAGGAGYRVALYADHNYNSTGDDSPEEVLSYAVGCEPYDGSTCGSFVVPQWQYPHPDIGDGLFRACGAGSTVTMKANDLQVDMLRSKVSSVEVRGATLTLYSGTHLTGTFRTYTSDTAALEDFNDVAQSARIVPLGISDVPTARDDSVATPEGTTTTFSPLANDAYSDGAVVRLGRPSTEHGAVTTDGTNITYIPHTGHLKTNGPDTFTYDVVYPNGVCDSGTVTVNVGMPNRPPANLKLVPTLAGSQVTAIDEGQTVTLQGTFQDPDGEAHTAIVDWGDGTDETVGVPTGLLNFEVSHRYADNQPAGHAGYVISGEVTDPGGLAAASSAILAVRNVAPTVTIDQTAGGLPFTPVGISVPLAAHFSDPGVLDTHTASVAWGDGQTDALGAVAPSGITTSHVFSQPGTFIASLAITDNDGGVGAASVPIEVVTPAEAAEQVADQLRALLPGANPQTQAQLQAAIDALASNNAGRARNGAAAKLQAGDLVAGLTMIGKAEAALDAITDVSVSVQETLITMAAQSVAEQAEADARARIGCVTLTDITCSADEGDTIATIDGYLMKGRAAFTAGRYLEAIGAFKNATQRAVEL